jgi:hypothetical protein
MKPSEYVKNQAISESNDFPAIRTRIDDRAIRLLHAAIGLNSELAELTDAAMKASVDYINVAEESGDCYWYASVAISALGLNPDDIMLDDMSQHKVDLEVKDYQSLDTALAGVVWSAGQFSDGLKKAIFYGRELNVEKMEDALKAITFSLSAVCYVSGTTPDEVRERNIAKLKVRYGDKFTAAESLNRDLVTERKVLEGETV